MQSNGRSDSQSNVDGMGVTKEHCYFCFDVLESHFENRKPMPAPFEDEKYPLFVTWNTVPSSSSTSKRRGSSDHQLRGCIGNFSAMPLHRGLAEYALTSALHDRRFSPIVASELRRLSCAVSLLVDFEDGSDYLDWRVGTHGIWIEFKSESGNKRTATYLPEVAKEQGWTKEEAVESLLRKGGHKGKITQEVKDGIVLTRYQSSKTSVTYEEYLDWKKQNQYVN
ncbi:ammecr1 protein [Fimicolochytrium jonesii]|uniref:ammecr1 protein n=1 Tax=Fimicolochytrium jonesii TaxID=1396493 RepID=UPI0022FED390|nr:ammecr1 protein [Fimicolochytrium jonesii]KAI8824971.1 ammecr1 protein [Fimicolochytrium jonesii]